MAPNLSCSSPRGASATMLRFLPGRAVWWDVVLLGEAQSEASPFYLALSKPPTIPDPDTPRASKILRARLRYLTCPFAPR